MSQEPTLLERIQAACYEEGDRTRIDCADALRVANEAGVAPIEIGKACNEAKIKIAGCQLGCFG
jgi:hypothetical protein